MIGGWIAITHFLTALIENMESGGAQAVLTASDLLIRGNNRADVRTSEHEMIERTHAAYRLRLEDCFLISSRAI